MFSSRIIVISLIVSSVVFLSFDKDRFLNTEKYNGVSFVSPPNEITGDKVAKVKEVNANSIAIIPYGFTRPGSSQVVFDSPMQWWGERPEGTRQLIDYAQEAELKICLKPQVYIPGSWVGEYDAGSEEEWQEWEKSYRKFIMTFAQIAEEKQVEVFCIGTEYKVAVTKRKDYWNALIAEIREVYKGEITYAANWDNYQNVPFWGLVDHIGVDSYFPLSDEPNESVENLVEFWYPIKVQLRRIATEYDKPILFTEYGYMDHIQAPWRNWVLESDRSDMNRSEKAQLNAFTAFYDAFWEESWVSGGFIWKWYAERIPNRVDYTPQGKKASKIISEYYCEGE